MSTFIPSSFFGVYRAISITSFPNLRRSITPTAPYHHRHIRVPLFHQFVRCHKVGRSKTKNSLSEGTCKHAPLPPSQQNGAVINKVLPGRDSVVKVHCVHTRPNFSLPWQMKRQSSSIGSGFVIEGRRVLTNAQSVDHHTLVKLMKRGSRIKYVARVLAIGTDCDLAMLTVEDDAFWEGLSPVELGGLPEIQDAVTVMGYPVGGDTLSVTSGVVSRMEIISYGRSTRLLGIQIDAAINAGNSGGPTFSDKGICVGMAFQSLKDEDDDVENIGYAIPTPVINHFIQDYEKNGAYTGFPDLEIELQEMNNPDFRLSMGMKPDQTGVRIRTINPASPVCEILKPNDVILSFDGVNIDNDGTVPYIHGESIDFSYLVAQKYSGDSAKIEILRESAIQNFEISLDSHRRLLLAGNSVKPPSYYIIAGFVFTTVSIPYLRSEYWAYDSNRLFNKLKHSKPDEEIVIVSQVLEADINNGYEEDDFEDNQVLAFNGEPVKNLKSLATMVESCSDEYMKFELEYQKVVVLRTDTAKAATLDILATHRIASAMSEDLQTNLNKPIMA